MTAMVVLYDFHIIMFALVHSLCGINICHRLKTKITNNAFVFLPGIAVDYINSNLYWSDEQEQHIMVSRLDGSHPYVLIQSLDKPRGIAVDPLAK